MKRQDITLGNTNYIVDLYDTYEDMSSSPHSEKFLMLRNGILENGIYDDTNIMFIQKSIIEECVNPEDNSIDVSKLTKVTVFPISNGTISYSNKYTEFSQNFNERTFKIGNNLEQIYNSNFEEASIRCDKLRIWIPTVKAKLNAIIDIEVFSNDIRIHLLCKKSNSFELNSEGEFKYDRDTYSEYIDLYIPNINDLFKKSKFYFLDTYNISGIKKRTVLSFTDSSEETFTSNVYRTKVNFETITETYDNDIPESDGSTRILAYPKDKSTVIVKDVTKEVVNKTTTKKITYDEVLTIDQQLITNANGLNYKLSVIANNGRTASKYKIAIDDDHIINYKENPIASSITLDDLNILSGKSIKIYDENDIEIYSIEISNDDLLYYDNMIYSSMHVFMLPSYIEQHNEFEIKTYDENLKSINSIYANEKIYYEETNLSHNKEFTQPLKVIMYPYSEYDSENDLYLGVEDENLNLDVFSVDYHIILQNSYKFIPEEGIFAIQAKFKVPEIYGDDNEDNLNEAYLDMVKEKSYTSYLKENEDYDEENDEIIPEGIEICGFKIDVATDIKFKNIVSYDIVNIDIEKEKKVIVNLDYAISARNLNVDWKSYPDFLVVRIIYYDRHTATVISGNYMMISKEEFKYMLNTNEGKRLNIKNKQPEEMNSEYFNFIDKINCTVVKKSDENLSSVQSNQRGTTKILYKPIFYRAKDLEQIKIKSGLTQNIGLNLASMISKVDTFKITIEDKEYVEIGRNDQYVIFKINALELSGSAGQYNLLDQNDEYISDGTWYLY